MNPGELRHRVRLQRLETFEDSSLSITSAWVDVAEVWSAIRDLSAKELVQAQAMQSVVSLRVVIRYRPDVDASMRIVHNNEVYNIHGVIRDPVSGNEYLTLPCSKGNNEG